jgi:hypothetical protein
MRTVFRGIGLVLPAASAMLILAACGSTTSGPTAASGAGTTSATAATEQSPVIVSGYVTDSAGRPLANANLECMGSVQCRALSDVTAQQQDNDHTVITNADGFYMLMATDGSADGDGQFLLNANARGYDVGVKSVRFADRVCTQGPGGCGISGVNFRLEAYDPTSASSRR